MCPRASLKRCGQERLSFIQRHSSETIYTIPRGAPREMRPVVTAVTCSLTHLVVAFPSFLSHLPGSLSSFLWGLLPNNQTGPRFRMQALFLG